MASQPPPPAGSPAGAAAVPIEDRPEDQLFRIKGRVVMVSGVTSAEQLAMEEFVFPRYHFVIQTASGARKTIAVPVGTTTSSSPLLPSSRKGSNFLPQHVVQLVSTAYATDSLVSVLYRVPNIVELEELANINAYRPLASRVVTKLDHGIESVRFAPSKKIFPILRSIAMVKKIAPSTTTTSSSSGMAYTPQKLTSVHSPTPTTAAPAPVIAQQRSVRSFCVGCGQAIPEDDVPMWRYCSQCGEYIEQAATSEFS